MSADSTYDSADDSNDEGDTSNVFIDEMLEDVYDLLSEQPIVLVNRLVLCLTSGKRCVFESHWHYIKWHEETTKDFQRFMNAHVRYELPISNEHKTKIIKFSKTLKPVKANSKEDKSQHKSAQTDELSDDGEFMPNDNNEVVPQINEINGNEVVGCEDKPAAVEPTEGVVSNQVSRIHPNRVSCVPSMEDYDVIGTHPDDHMTRTAIGMTNKALFNCKAPCSTAILHEYSDMLHAMIKTDQYGRKFDACGIMTRPQAGVRDTKDGNCNCDQDKYKSVVHSGCIECCTVFPRDIRICKCHAKGKAFQDNPSMMGTFPRGGCMHPLEWDTDNIHFSKNMFSLCLVCGTFDRCEHQRIHKDVEKLNYHSDAFIYSLDIFANTLKEIEYDDIRFYESHLREKGLAKKRLNDSGSDDGYVSNDSGEPEQKRLCGQ
ncbi:hypothetical protein T484DRAFT_1756607 [Baffinella frigidus]|nr:hypothetical protein T484DRAFT_1756607 [Cryptophyta sp. CCMP2293]